MSLDLLAERELDGSYYSTPYRYFSLFAQAASARLSIDWGHALDGVIPYGDAFDEAGEDYQPPIPVANIHLLVSERLKYKKASHTYEVNNDKVKLNYGQMVSGGELIKLNEDDSDYPVFKIGPDHMPIPIASFAEAAYSYILRKPSTNSRFVTRQYAIEFLDRTDRYTSTRIAIK